MAVRVIESESREYFRYEFKVSKYKDNMIKVSCIDNYWDKSDYMIVDNDTGEISSYNDVALNRCMQMIDKCRIDVYNLVAGTTLRAYLTNPFGELVRVDGAELKESNTAYSEEDDKIAYTSIANSLKRKASKLNKITDNVADGLLVDVGIDCCKISDMLKNGSIDEALKSASELTKDAATILSTAKQLEATCEGIINNAERLQKMYK